MVSYYIIECLYDKDYVMVPQLGSFVASHKSAKVDFATNQFFPPYKEWVFNEAIISDDNSFVEFIAKREEISLEESKQLVSGYVSDLKANILDTKLFEIEGFGEFFMNEGKIEFRTISENFLSGSFGLPSFKVNPVKQISNFNPVEDMATRTPVRGQRKPLAKKTSFNEDGTEIKKDSLVPILISVFIVMLFVTGYVSMYYYHDQQFSQGSLNPIKWNFKAGHSADGENLATSEEVSSEEIVSESGDETASDYSIESEMTRESNATAKKEKDVAISSTVISASTLNSKMGRYFVIVGAFEKERNAIRLKEKLLGNGADAKVIAPYDSKSLYRVSVEDHGNLREAVKRMRNLRSDYGNTIWVLTY